MDIKADIFKYGKAMFSTKGFKKTNIKEIAESAGIGVGTFYNYYASKDQLFLEIYIQENENLKKSLMESIDLDQEPLKVINQLIMGNIGAIQTNPILKEWYSQDFYKKLEQYYQNEGSKNMDSFRDFYMDLFKKWKDQGKIREDIDEDLLPVFFDSLVYIDTHKEDIGIQHFPKIIQYLAEFIMQGLTNHQK
ncbi:TetR/AcrR family transcriptional regulator [Paenibacillus nasutitermitis]|uniref:TetR family transcriptional regulator n=1 Tax=Paenibacillus nasutitermitis TaxID=1652958 RepID=A0A916YTQ4_9BACL|nr:TetR/AcrR family transcriptional regulator [Paenibacillus nasutitermitis]GGD59872.1 TetR family transcriptional regulator [Paenibacillus nasutitermitis]